MLNTKVNPLEGTLVFAYACHACHSFAILAPPVALLSCLQFFFVIESFVGHVLIYVTTSLEWSKWYICTHNYSKKGDTLAIGNAAGSTTRLFFFSRSHPSTYLTTATEADEHVKNKLILAEQTSAHWRRGHIWILRKIPFTYLNQGRAFIGLTRRTAKFRLNNRIFYTGISFGTVFAHILSAEEKKHVCKNALSFGDEMTTLKMKCDVQCDYIVSRKTSSTSIKK